MNRPKEFSAGRNKEGSKKRSGLLDAQHPFGRSGRLVLPPFSALLALLLQLAILKSGVPAADKTPLITTLDDKHAAGTDLWIYNDIPRAIKEARRSNRPILVTFRCVPCEACSGFDAEVAQGNDRIVELARRRFVAVRQVEMKGVDLSQFQFDHDLNWAAMFINADGVVYARYGTQSAAGAEASNSIEGFEKTMRRVLRLHEQYPGNRAELTNKRAAPKPWKTALDMPGMRNRNKLRGATDRRNCIHCHMIHDAEHAAAYERGTFTHEMLWRYPLPDNIGLIIDRDDGNRIESVKSESPAAAAGLKPGEDVTHMNGQAMTSIADMQWVLHHIPNTDTVLAVRGSRSGKTSLRLRKGWKVTDISWRGSLWSVRPQLRVWTPELKPQGRRKHNLADDRLALEVRWINRSSSGGRSAFDAGLRQGDVVVALAERTTRMSAQHFNMHIKLNYNAGDELPITILRNGREKRIRIRLVD